MIFDKVVSRVITQAEKAILRELARQYAGLAAEPVNAERKARCKRINDCIADRPPVWIDEIPWREMDIEGQLRMQCEDPAARAMEWFFREKLFCWRYFQADMVLTPYYPMRKAVITSGYGVAIEEDRIAMHADDAIVSHHYHDMLETPEQVEKLHPQTISIDEAATARTADMAQDVLGEILPARFVGGHVSSSPWDAISMLRGVEPILMDMIERPEHLHHIMQKFVAIDLSRMEQLERLGLLDAEPLSLHCTPPYVSDLPAPEQEGSAARLKDVWIRGTAQMFSTVSPAMHWEFELEYMKPLFERCGLTYYGCCEPLDGRIDMLKRIANMRKIGVSPWSNVRRCAEEMGPDYVMARKPNPAFLAQPINEQALRDETRESILAAKDNGCALEFVLKDISTVGEKPERLIEWNRIVQSEIDRHYACS